VIKLTDLLPSHSPFHIMGIVNVTEDSFYDGGKYNTAKTAVDHALRLIDEGADCIDIGGESTRPGAEPVAMEEELRRVIPVIETVAQRTTVPISVDTTKAEVARRAIDSGAVIINDISAGRFDANMAPLAAKTGALIILMHSRKTPKTMQKEPYYTDPVNEVLQELNAQVESFQTQGVSKTQIIIDPGIGFSKRLKDNLALLTHLARFVDTGYPVLLGTSRKSFLGMITGRDVPDRLSASLATVAAAMARGVSFFRVHDVAETNDFLKVYQSIISG